MRVVPILLILATIGAGPGDRRPPRSAPADIIRRAIDAAGGEAALRGLRNVTFETGTFARNRGQEDAPGAPPNAQVVTIRGIRDREGRRIRNEQEARFTGGGVVNRAVQIVTRDAGVFMLADGSRIFVPPPNLQQQALNGLDNFMPVALLRMLDQPDSVSAAPQRRIAGQMADGIRFVTNGAPVTIWFDPRSGLPLLQEAVADDPILGDVTTTITWSQWTRGAVRFPGQAFTDGGRGTNAVVQMLVGFNQPMADSLFAIADSNVQRFRTQATATTSNNPNAVTLSSLAHGVWRVAGQQYNALVVEQPDRLVLVEAPLNADYTQAILDTLAARFPGKRVGLAVNTHHHWDHAGGVRTVLANGIPVVTRDRNVEFVRGVGTARKTVKPDALSRGRRLPQITGVTDSMTLGSGDSRVVLYPVETTQDGGAHLVAYVPASGVLFMSDILSPPAAGATGPGATLPRPASVEVVGFAQRYGMTVSQVVGGHGGVATWEAVSRAAQ